MEIISTTALISINATFIAQMLSFMIFVFILNRLMLRPLTGVIEQRREFTEGMKNDISSADQKLKDLVADLENQKEAVKNEAFKVNKEMEQLASEEAAGLFTDVRKQIVQMSQAAEKDLDRQFKEAQKYFEEETQAISVIMMEQVLGRKMS